MGNVPGLQYDPCLPAAGKARTLSLPVEDDLFGNVYRYYIKATETGQFLFGLATDVSLSASTFAGNNLGIITAPVAVHNRFAVAVDQEYLKERRRFRTGLPAAGHASL